MLNHESLSDEQLVHHFQNGDEYCLNVLMNRYKNFIKKQARLCHYSYQTIDEEDFISTGNMALYSAAETFDPARINGKPFRYFLKMKINCDNFDYARSHTFNEIKENGKRMGMVKKETPQLLSIEKMMDQTNANGGVYQIGIKDESADIEKTSDLYQQELYEYLKSKSETDAKVAVLISQGYVYSEIVKLLNLKNKMNVKRAQERNQKHAKNYLKNL